MYRNAQIIAKTLVAHLYDYNTSETPKVVSSTYQIQFAQIFNYFYMKKNFWFLIFEYFV